MPYIYVVETYFNVFSIFYDAGKISFLARMIYSAVLVIDNNGRHWTLWIILQCLLERSMSPKVYIRFISQSQFGLS